MSQTVEQCFCLAFLRFCFWLSNNWLITGIFQKDLVNVNGMSTGICDFACLLAIPLIVNDGCFGVFPLVSRNSSTNSDSPILNYVKLSFETTIFFTCLKSFTMLVHCARSMYYVHCTHTNSNMCTSFIIQKWYALG